jgi:hypothetical protein
LPYISSNTVYWIQVITATVAAYWYVDYGYERGRCWCPHFDWGGAPAIGADFSFRVYIHASSGIYISTTKNMGSNWTDWDKFESVEDNKGWAINYFVATSTWDGGLNNFSPVSQGNIIDSTTGPYIRWRVEISTTSTATGKNNCPYILTVNILWHSTYPVHSVSSAIYDDRYWLSVSTLSDSSNSMILIQDQRDNWTKFTGMDAYSLSIFDQKLYFGTSNNTGQVYRIDETATNDDINAVDGYYTTKIFDFGLPDNEKIIRTIYLTGKNDYSTVELEYRINGSTGAWTTVNIPFDEADRIITQKVPIPHVLRCYYIQFRLRNNELGKKMNVNGLRCYYELVEKR